MNSSFLFYKNVFNILIFLLILFILFFIYFNYSISNSYYSYNFHNSYKLIECLEGSDNTLPDNVFNDSKLNQEINKYQEEFKQHLNDIENRIENKKNTEISLYNFFNEFKTNFSYFNQSVFRYYIYLIASYFLHNTDEKKINKTDIYTLYKYIFPDSTFLQHSNIFNREINTDFFINIYISLKIYNKLHNDSFFYTLDEIHKSFEPIDTQPLSKTIPNTTVPPLELIKNYNYYNNYKPRPTSFLQQLIEAQIKEIDKIVNQHKKNNNKITSKEFLKTSNLDKKYLYLAVLRLEMFYYEHGVKNFEQFYTEIIGKNISNKNMYKYLFNDNEETKFNDKTYQKNLELFFPRFMDRTIIFYLFITQIYPIKFLDAFNEYENL
tara:strand:- start:25 stop:1161 length:1137 start_codon:yes stop_codon:yes gene_type:complete